MATQSNPAPPFYRDIRVLRFVVQLIILIVVVLIVGLFISNTVAGLRRAGINISYDFLEQPSSFQIDEGLVPSPHTREQSFANAFFIGFINTMRVIVVGLVLTTILGLVMGIARLSSNWLIRQIAVIYIEIAQNTPLLLQLIFIYVGVLLTLPSVRESVELPGPIFLSVRGLAMPSLVGLQGALPWLLIASAGGALGVWLWQNRRKRQIETGQRSYGFEIGLAVIMIVGGVAWLALRPFEISLPERIGPRYNADKGIIVSPEFVAIVAGLVLYTGAFVAEIVRAGIQSVPRGQWEASRSQGFSYFQTLRFVVLPQALRVMIPPLTNQYLNLIKNSSLGAAVGFSDIFGIGRTIQLNSGQSVPVIVIVMLTYLVLDLLAAFAMNALNSRIQFKTR